MTKKHPLLGGGADLLSNSIQPQPPAAAPRKRGENKENKIIAELRAGKEKRAQPVKTVLDWSRIGAAGLILAVALSPVPAHALFGMGGKAGGATEVTQLANHAELVAQVGEAVQTTSNTLMTAEATLRMLRQLPEQVISQMTNLPIAELQVLANAYSVMARAVNVYREAEAVLRQADADSMRLNITPAQLFRMKAEAAYRYGGVYKTTYEQEQAKLAALEQTSQDVQEQAEKVQSVDANVKGIQFLATQNLNLQAALASINESISKANMLALMEAEKDKEKEAEALMRESDFLDKRRQAVEPGDSTLPLPVR